MRRKAAHTVILTDTDFRTSNARTQPLKRHHVQTHVHMNIPTQGNTFTQINIYITTRTVHISQHTEHCIHIVLRIRATSWNLLKLSVVDEFSNETRDILPQILSNSIA